MGTFIIKPTTIASLVNSWFSYDGAAGWSTSNANLLLGANNAAVTQPTLHSAGAVTLFGGLDAAHVGNSGTNDQIRFGFSGACIYLDGSLVPVDFSGLPAGFTPLTLSSRFRYNNDGAAGTPGCYLQFDALTESANLWSTPIHPNMGVVTYNYPSTIPSISSILSGGMGIRVDNRGFPGAFLNGEFVGVQLTGTYELQNFQFNMPIDVQPVTPGTTQVTVTSDLTDPDHLKLNELSAVDVTFDNDSFTFPVLSFITQDEDLLIFIIPTIGGHTPGVLKIKAVGNGVQFGGTVTLGKLETIYFLNAPGIYKLDSAATADTLYDIENGGTIQVAIPDPFFKTGFIGS